MLSSAISTGRPWRRGSKPRSAHERATDIGLTMRAKHPGRVALLYPGDRAARDRSDRAESRFAALFEAFAVAGIVAEPAAYHDDFADEVEAQLREATVVQVWCNPIEGGRRRDRLDA